MMPFSMTSSDPNPDFVSAALFDVEYFKKVETCLQKNTNSNLHMSYSTV